MDDTYLCFREQRKCQYKAPDGRKFQSKVLALRYVNNEEVETESKVFDIKSRRSLRNFDPRDNYSPAVINSSFASTKWDEWRDDEIPCLLGWQFSIGRQGTKRKIRYKSPTGEVFGSRGPLLRYLQEKGLKSKEQLAILKKCLKTNQGLPVNDLLRNDKFIKNFDPDNNYLEFIKVRYENESHSHIPEVVDPKLPEGWLKKTINGVDYFKDPTGYHVFNSRKLVVEHLRRNYYDFNREYLDSILDDSETDSDLSESEEESDNATAEVVTNDEDEFEEMEEERDVEEEEEVDEDIEEEENEENNNIEFVYC